MQRRENHNRSKNSRVAMYSALSKHASLKGRTMFNHIIFSLCVTYVSASIQGSCHITDEKCAICPKQEVIPLIHLEDVSFWSEKGIMFFIESADRTHLLPRQACSVESALKTNPNLYIIVAMTTDTLDLSSNVTCHLYSQFGERRLFFRHVDASELSQRTPLQDLFKSNLLWDSQYGIVQLSDALRLLLVQRYGGVYSDLDMIYLQSVEGLRNFISGDHNRNDYKFTMISNGIFHFSPNHTFTQEILRRFATTFNPEDRLSGGPELFTRAFEEFCRIRIAQLREGDEDLSGTPCHGLMDVLWSKKFYPVGWFDYDVLISHKRKEIEWIEFFSNSYAVHFYNSLSENKTKMLRRKFYGADIPALLFLALSQCPVAFESERMF